MRYFAQFLYASTSLENCRDEKVNFDGTCVLYVTNTEPESLQVPLSTDPAFFFKVPTNHRRLRLDPLCSSLLTC